MSYHVAEMQAEMAKAKVMKEQDGGAWAKKAENA
jgi:hypothetical protein